MKCVVRIGLALLLLLGAGSAGSANLSPEASEALDTMLACERNDGGWMYACPPRGGPYGVTKVVNLGARTRAFFGLEPWDLVVLRSPGTPAAGLLLLEAFEKSGEPRYLEAARRTGDLLLNLQLPSGGWFSEMPAHGDQLPLWFEWLVPWTTLDDDVTSGAIRFLLELFRVADDPRYRAAANRGLDLLLESQLPSGGWPLTHRPAWVRATGASFEDLPSLNDAATAAIIQTLLLGARVLDRPELVAAAVRGGDWLVTAQLPAPTRGWAQQYGTDGQPVAGRAFEPTAAASWETRHAIEALVALARETGDQRYCPAITDALAWLQDSALAPGCWARFISLDDGAPIFVDARGEPVSHPAQAKRPYRWTGDFGIPAVLASQASLSFPQRVVPRLPGDAGDCPGANRRAVPRHETTNPRARIGEVGSVLGALREPPEPVCSLSRRELSASIEPGGALNPGTRASSSGGGPQSPPGDSR